MKFQFNFSDKDVLLPFPSVYANVYQVHLWEKFEKIYFLKLFEE